MRKASKHSAILLLIGVFALGLLGAAYTLWYENLSLNATVNTGTFDADLSLHNPADGSNSTNDPATQGRPVVYVNPANPPALSGGVASVLDGGPRHFTDGASGYDLFLEDNYPEGKPKTTCTGTLTNDTDANQNAQTSSLTLNLGGLFPYAGCEFEIDITNAGTVPLHFGVTKLDFYECTGPGTGCAYQNPSTGAPWSTGLDPDQPQLAECAAWLGNMFGQVVDPAGPTMIHNFNGGPLGWDDFQQINTGVSSPWGVGQNPVGFSTAALTNVGANTAVQLHAGQSVNCKFKMILDQNPNAEGKHYQFKAEIIAYQWNETPSN